MVAWSVRIRQDDFFPDEWTEKAVYAFFLYEPTRIRLLSENGVNNSWFTHQCYRSDVSVVLDASNDITLRFKLKINSWSGEANVGAMLFRDANNDDRPGLYVFLDRSAADVKFWLITKDAGVGSTNLSTVVSVSAGNDYYVKVVITSAGVATATLGTSLDSDNIGSLSGVSSMVDDTYVYLIAGHQVSDAAAPGANTVNADMFDLKVSETTTPGADTLLGNVEKFNYTQILNSPDTATIYLIKADEYDEDINGLVGQTITISKDKDCFQGLVEEVHIIDRYQFQLILRDMSVLFTRREHETSYKLDEGISTAIGANSLTDTEKSWGVNEFSGGDYGFVIVPGSDPSFSEADNFDTDHNGALTATRETWLNTDDTNSLYVGLSSHAAHFFEGELTGAAKAAVDDIEIIVKVKSIVRIALSRTLDLQMWDYTDNEWDTLDTVVFPPGLLGHYPIYEFKVVVNDNRYIDTATAKFKLRVALDSNDILYYYYLKVNFYTDPRFAGKGEYAITANTAIQLTTGGTPSADGVASGDHYLIGKKNSVVLAAVIAEHEFFLVASVDSGMTSINTSDYDGNNATSQEVVTNTLRREQGFWYVKHSDHTVNFVKRANLDDLTATYDFGNVQDVLVKKVSNKSSGIVKKVVVTGGSYKILDDEIFIYHVSEASGVATSRVLRIDDDMILSQSEAKAVGDGELVIANNTDPSFRFEYNADPHLFYPGMLVFVTYDSVQYTLPIQMITVTVGSHDDWRQVIECGWTATPAQQQLVNRLNKIQRQIKRNVRGLSQRSAGVSSGPLTSHTHTLDVLDNPTAQKTFTFSTGKSMKFAFSGVKHASHDGLFEIEAIGAPTSDIVHIHQHTGNPGVIDLVHILSVDADVTPLRIGGNKDIELETNTNITGNLGVTGNVDGRDISADIDQAVKVASTPTFAGITVVNAITEFSTDDTLAGDSDSALPTEQAVKAYVDAHGMIGNANRQNIPCSIYGMSNFDYGKVTVDIIQSTGADDFVVNFLLTLPTNRGGLKLYIDQIQIDVRDADADDYITSRYLYGSTDSGNNEIYGSNNNITTADSHQFGFGAHDCSSYDYIIGYLSLFCTTSAELDIVGVSLRCYYAA